MDDIYFRYSFFESVFLSLENHLTIGQSHSRETKASVGRMFLAPPTHNDGDHLCVELTQENKWSD